jgi:hypothetical protein
MNSAIVEHNPDFSRVQQWLGAASSQPVFPEQAS